MFNKSAVHRNKSPELPLAYPGAPLDSESTRQPPLPGTSYTPYSENPAQSEPAYKPYAEKPVDDSPYEPYKDI